MIKIWKLGQGEITEQPGSREKIYIMLAVDFGRQSKAKHTREFLRT